MANITIFWGDAKPDTELQYRVSGTSTWTTVNVSNRTEFTVVGLLDYTLYQFRIKRTCSGNITYSSIIENMKGERVNPVATITPTSVNFTYSISNFSNITNIQHRLFRNGNLVSTNIITPTSNAQSGSFSVDGYNGIYTVDATFNVAGYSFFAGISNEVYLTCSSPVNFLYAIS